MKPFFLILVVFITFPLISSAQTLTISSPDSMTADSVSVVQDTLMSRSPRGAMLRSLALPGWGQFYNGKWFKGLVIGGTEVGLIIDAVVQNQWAQESVYYYDKEFYRENRSLAIWWLAGVVLYSVTDAFVDAHLADFDDTPNVSMQMKHEQDIYTNNRYAVYQLTLAIPF